jgi:hypothetical protein
MRENDTSPVYVLDNQVPDLLTGPERRDLTAIFIFLNGSRLYIIGDDGKKRFVKNEFKGQEIRKMDHKGSRKGEQEGI